MANFAKYNHSRGSELGERDTSHDSEFPLEHKTSGSESSFQADSLAVFSPLRQPFIQDMLPDLWNTEPPWNGII